MKETVILVAVSLAFYLTGVEPPDTIILGFLAVIYYNVKALRAKG